MPTLTQAANEYYEHLMARGRAHGTAHDRRLTVLLLVQEVGDIQTASVTPRHVDKLFTARSHWSQGTRNNQLTNLRLFFTWCRFRRYMAKDNDPMFGWQRESYNSPERLRIPVHKWPQLFEACDSPVETIAVATGLYLFLRGSEQQHIQLKHVHLDRNEIEIYRKKTRTWDTMPISAELEPYLRRHLTWLATQHTPDPDHYLIPARTPPKVQKGTSGFIAGSAGVNPTRPFGKPYLVVQEVLERAGYPTHKEGEHTLRRSGARAYFDSLVEQGYDGALRRVMSMLGHKHSTMTEHYLGLNLDRLKRNNDLRGKPMFPVQDANIIPLRKEM